MWVDQFLKCLSVIDDKKLDIDRAMDLKNANLPSQVYKYRSVNYFLFRMLKTDTVWACSPTCYNDPYDSAFTHSIENASRGMIDKCREIFAEILIEQNLLPISEIGRAVGGEDLAASYSEALGKLLGSSDRRDSLRANLQWAITAYQKKWMKEAQEYLEEVRNSVRVCSFSIVRDSIVMWSHYASSHTGVCLEYDISNLSPRNHARDWLYPVIYSDTFFDITDFVAKRVVAPHSVNEMFRLLAALHKSPDWSYEREWRLVLLWETRDREFPMPKPRKLYYGTRIATADRDRIEGICRARGIPTGQMRLSANSFSLLSPE